MPIENNIVDINIEGASRKRFRINGDDSKIVELNTSDLNIMHRIEKVYPKLEELQKESITINIEKKGNSNRETILNTLKTVNDKLSDIDKRMREYLNYIFDFNVCSVCAESGSMFDPIGGKPRFEIILEALITLYQDNIIEESNKIKDRINSYTQKYKENQSE